MSISTVFPQVHVTPLVSPRMENANRPSSSLGRIYGWLPHNAIYDREAFTNYTSQPQNARLLRLKIFSGHNLAKKDIFGASDPYVRIDLLRSDKSVIDSVYTKTKKKTLNPSWNEEFIFRVIPSSHQLLIEVFDENRLTRDDFLGKVELPLSNIPEESEDNEVVPTRYILQQRSVKSKVRGDLEIYHAYVKDSNTQNNFSEDSMPRASEENGDSDWEIVTHPSSHSRGHEVANDFNEELPSGWEECQDTNGRTYFVNHNTRSTQWERPLNNVSTGETTETEQNENVTVASQEVSIPPQSTQRNYDLAQQDFCRRFHIGSSLDQSTVLPSDQATSGSTSSISVDDSSPYIPNIFPYTNARQNPLAANQRTKSLTSGSESTDSNTSLTGSSANSSESSCSSASNVTHSTRDAPQGAIAEAQAPIKQIQGDNEVNSLEVSTLDMASRRHSEPSASVASPPSDSSETNQQSQSAAQTRPHSHHHHHHRHHHNHQDQNQSNNANHTNTHGNRAPSDQSSQSHNHRPRAQTSTTTRSSRTVPDDGLGPLPTGWSQQIAETGRAFYIDHNSRTTTWVDPRTGKPSPSPQSQQNSRLNTSRGTQSKTSAVDDLGPLPPGWEERVHRDGRIFFINHNTRSTQWEDPRIDNPNISGPPVLYSRDYKQKYDYFMNSLPRPTNVPNKFEVKVSRSNILEDSFRIISNVSRVDYLKTKLWIEFDNEEVLDYGGPCREWFYLLSKEMFNPYYGLFEYSSADKYTLQIKPYSGRCNESHLAYFKFIGRVAGMAIYHGKLLDAFFIRPFYKMMLGKDIQLKDMESVDSEYFNSLKYILENDPNELYLNFSIDERFLDVVEEKELKPNGSQTPVTNDNKLEYINLVIDWRFVSRVKPQMSSFLEGFHELIPKKLIEIFDENELELLMCGIGNVDVKDWKQNTVYKGGYVQNHIVIQWFWRVVLSFNNEMRSRLLQFVTGTSRVPMNGFKELYGSNGPQLFTIEKWGTSQNLPRSHTCFNRLDLPCYESYSDLREKLIKAIEGSESYGGVD